jgi:putative membrane protein
VIEDRAATRSLVRGLILAGFGLLIFKLMVLGQMAKYMNTALDPLTAGAGLMLLLLGGWELRIAWSRRAVEGSRLEEDLEHNGEQVLTYALLVATLLLGFTVAPRALGTGALAGEDLASYLLAFNQQAAQRDTSAGKLTPDQPIEDLSELLAYLGQVGEAGVGQPVRVTGLVARSGGLEPGELAVLRYSIVHCVADARPLGFLIANVTAPAELDQWVQVEGVVGLREREGQRLFVVESVSLMPVNEPADPYIHPF